MLKRNFEKEEPIVETKRVQAFDENIQIPVYVFAYRTPAQNQKRFLRTQYDFNIFKRWRKFKTCIKKLLMKKMALAAQASNWHKRIMECILFFVFQWVIIIWMI